MKLHIGVTGYIGTDHVAQWLNGDPSTLPKGQPNAPLLGVLIGELLKQGHKVSAFTTDTSLYKNTEIIKVTGPNFDFYICPERPRAWRFNRFRLGRAIDGFAFERNKLLNAMQEANPDIIHAHWTYEFAMPAIKSGIPHLITCHDAPAVILRFNPYPFRFIRYLMARWVFNKGQHFTAVSKYLADAVQHYTKQKITVIPNPIADFVLNTGHIRAQPKTRSIGMICNGWDARKNAQPSLIAFAKFKEIEPTAELHLFGYGFGINEEAQHWCQERNITKGLIFHGATPHQKLIDQLNHLDLLLHPALEETFCVAIAEAMALGLPIVAGRHSGAIPDVVGVSASSNIICCAALTDVTDPDKILNALITVFDINYSNRSKHSFERARQLFTANIVNKSYESLYQQILTSRI
ncbi:MAG: glycosyltransferase family 4 protein [Methylococcales bacterium]|nr:glycosyltransferase family 4 protein [Methylococcales bacterium]